MATEGRSLVEPLLRPSRRGRALPLFSRASLAYVDVVRRGAGREQDMAVGVYEAEFRAVVASVRDVIRERAGMLLRLALAGGALSWLLMAADAEINRLAAAMGNRAILTLAKAASFFGDFATLVLPAMVLLWFLGYSLRRRVWRMAALAGLVAAVLAGLAANTVKRAADRIGSGPEAAGPAAHVAVIVHHSSVSAQTATVFGAAAVLAAALPPARVPVMGVALLVAWSRVQLQRHNPSGVVLGAALGLWMGLLFGMAARRAAGRPDVPGPVREFDLALGRFRRRVGDRVRAARRWRFARTHVEVRAPRPPRAPGPGGE